MTKYVIFNNYGEFKLPNEKNVYIKSVTYEKGTKLRVKLICKPMKRA